MRGIVKVRLYSLKDEFTDQPQIWEDGFEEMSMERWAWSDIARERLAQYTDTILLTKLGIPSNKNYQIMFKMEVIDNDGAAEVDVLFHDVKIKEIPDNYLDMITSF